VNADEKPRDPPWKLLLLLLDKMEDVAKGEMERRFLPPMDPIGLLMALMFGEDDLLRINLDKDDMMMMTMVHNLYNRITFDFN